MPTQREVADWIDVNGPRYVRELRDGGVIPEPTTSTREEITTAYIRHLREIAAGRVSKGVLDLSAERARLAKEQADAQELKNALARGEYVPGDQIESTAVAVLSGVRTRLLAVPAKAAPEAHGAATIAEVEAAFRKHQTEALEALADTG